MTPSICSWLILLAAPTLVADAPSDRMARIEHGLRPAVTFEGDTPWTLEERMRHYQVPAVAIAVIQDFEVAEFRVYGVADRESGERATRDTLFQAGSVSKPVAAFGAVKLASSGAVTLEGDVNDVLTSWRLPDTPFTAEEKVTLTHLLSHTGGLTVHGFPGYAEGKAVPTTIQVLDGSGPANTPPVRVNQVPGEGYRYSGGGYTIAQLVMVDATGTPFPALMDELVLQPVGMERSSFLNPLPSELLKNAAAGYLPDHSAVEGKRHTYPEMAAAGLWTTAEDLARFAIEVQLALRGESDVLDRESAELLVEPVTDRYGRGFQLARRDRAPYFFHGGWDEGFCATLTAHRTAGYGAVVMINSNHPQLMDEIVRGIAEEYGWAGYAPFPMLEAPAVALELYPGRYRYNAETTLTVERRDDRLFMRYIGEDAQELHHVGDGRFMRRERAAPITFTVEDSVPTFHFITGDGSMQSHARMDEGDRTPREILMDVGEEAALPHYRALHERSPDDPAVSERWLSTQAMGMAEGGLHEPALGLLRIASELYPEAAGIRGSMGDVYRSTGQLDAALHWYRLALEANPNLANAVKGAVEVEAELRSGPAIPVVAQAPADAETGANSIVIRALIDGSDVVNVRGDRVWFEHLNFARPGAWSSSGEHDGSEPTFVNGVEWVPQWEGKISREHTVPEGLLPPEQSVSVTVAVSSDRGRVIVLEQPSEKNDHTLSVLLDDDALGGAAWYELRLRW